MTPEEEKVSELRSLIVDITKTYPRFDDDLYLLQWLKGSKLNVEKTEARIRNSVKWRNENNIDELLAAPFDEEMMKKVGMKTDGRSKDGVAVVSVALQHVDWRGLIDEYGSDRHLKYWRKWYLHLETLMIENNKDRNQGKKEITSDSAQGLLLIADCKKISLYQLSSPKLISFHIQMLRELATYYPNVAGSCIFLNVPVIMKAAIKLLKSALEGPNFVIEVYGDDEAALEKHIYARIAPGQFQTYKDENGHAQKK